ncbi:MAG: type 1 glutamine amidotransferase [Actinomycetota bacterium]|nr:type 1 glutamine amidotransferase [Actinomycetota bacterium]
MANVAFIVDEMFEDSEFKIPFERVPEAGHDATVVGIEANKTIEGKKGKETVTTQIAIDDVNASGFDAVVIPGGYSPDHLRANEKMVQLVKQVYEAGKPVAAVCHGPWMLVEADILRGKTVTSWPSIKTDVRNAGAEWVDQEVVEDGNIITSRKPDDLEAFSKAVLSQIEQTT